MAAGSLYIDEDRMMTMEFTHKAPTFAPGPLKKEILIALRDLTYTEQMLRYQEYSDGILYGCKLYEQNMHIGILSGIIKYAGRVYMLADRTSVSYEPTDSWTALKIRFGAQRQSREYTHFTGQLVLDTNTQTLPNEMEMGRFKLKKGSALRTEYKDFHDMNTEYDTVNLQYVKQAGLGKPTLSPEITRHFAREAYPYTQDNALDAAFCGSALNGKTMTREYIERYICTRTGQECREMENNELLKGLENVLRTIRGTSEVRKRREHSGIDLFD